MVRNGSGAGTVNYRAFVYICGAESSVSDEIQSPDVRDGVSSGAGTRTHEEAASREQSTERSP